MSHGPVDVFAAKKGHVVLIQVKSGSSRIKKEELALLKKWAEAFDARAEVWSFRRRGGLEKKIVRKPGQRPARGESLGRSLRGPKTEPEVTLTKQALKKIGGQVEKNGPARQSDLENETGGPVDEKATLVEDRLSEQTPRQLSTV